MSSGFTLALPWRNLDTVDACYLDCDGPFRIGKNWPINGSDIL